MNKKFLIAPVEIAGYCSNLVKGFDQLKINYDFIKYENEINEYFYETKNPLLIFLAKKINLIKKINKYKYLKWPLTIIEESLKKIWGISAIFRYDIFIFTFGRSLLVFNIDLLIIRILGKKIISNIGFGSEARPPYLSGLYLNVNNKQIKKIKKIKKKVDFHQKYSNIVIGAPSTCHFLKIPFINWHELGFPIHIKNFSNKNLNNFKHTKSYSIKKVRILHCPSNIFLKKTILIIKTIKNIEKNVNVPLIAHGVCGSEEDINTLFKLDICSLATGSLVVYSKKDNGVLVNFPDKVLN